MMEKNELMTKGKEIMKKKQVELDNAKQDFEKIS